MIIKSNIKAFIRYSALGAITASVQFLSFGFLCHLFLINYLIATAISYLLGMLTSFIGNRFFTFKNKEPQVVKQIIKYMIMAGINFIITMIIMHGVVKHFQLSPYIALCLAILITVSWGYLMSKNWVFKIHSIEQ